MDVKAVPPATPELPVEVNCMCCLTSDSSRNYHLHHNSCRKDDLLSKMHVLFGDAFSSFLKCTPEDLLLICRSCKLKVNNFFEFRSQTTHALGSFGQRSKRGHKASPDL